MLSKSLFPRMLLASMRMLLNSRAVQSSFRGSPTDRSWSMDCGNLLINQPRLKYEARFCFL